MAFELRTAKDQRRHSAAFRKSLIQKKVQKNKKKKTDRTWRKAKRNEGHKTFLLTKSFNCRT